MIIEIIGLILILIVGSYMMIDDKKYNKGKIPFSKRLENSLK